jgi:Ca-activated chloride channel family protein
MTLGDLQQAWAAWPTYTLGAPERAALFYGVGAVALWALLRWAFGQALPVARAAGQAAGAGWLRWLAPLPRLLRILGLILLVLALLRPQVIRNSDERSVQSLDIMLALDLSGSMQTNDLLPSRVEAAKATLKDFVHGLSGDRVGLVVFAAKAFTQCPLTLDHGVVEQFIDQMQLGTVAIDGTALGDGLLMCVSRLAAEKGAKDKVAIVATDGRSNTGADPYTAAELAAEAGVRVYMVGMGRKGGAIVRDRFGNVLGREEEPDEPLMTRMAQVTGGRYFRATDAESLHQIYDQIATLEKHDVKVKHHRDADEHFYPFLLAGALLLLAEALLRLRLRVSP